MIRNFDIQADDIVIFHIGAGAGGLGHLNRLIEHFGKKCVLYGFDANPTKEDIDDFNAVIKQGVRPVFVKTCIAEKNGKSNFYINKAPASSSMLPPALGAINDHIIPWYTGESWVFSWGDNTILDRMVEMETQSLSDFIKSEGIVPDVLSMDIQGMEFAVMCNIEMYLDDIGMVFTESEFFEIYEGQGLFTDQMEILRRHRIRLAGLFGNQSWHPGPAVGEGFLTVTESLWFREVEAVISKYDRSEQSIIKAIKQAAMGFSFNRLSYAYMIIEELCKLEDRMKIEHLCESLGYAEVLTVCKAINEKMPEYIAATSREGKECLLKGIVKRNPRASKQ